MSVNRASLVRCWLVLSALLVLSATAGSAAWVHGAVEPSPASIVHEHGEVCVAVGGLICALGAIALLGARARTSGAPVGIAARVRVVDAIAPWSGRARHWRSAASLCAF